MHNFLQPAAPLLAVLCIGLFGLGGCAGADPTTGTTRVAGQVVLGAGGRPVGGGTVQVQRASAGGGYSPVGTPVACDAAGRFAFAFEATERFGYRLTAQAPPGYVTDWDTAPALTAGRDNPAVRVPVLAPAWVRLQLVDEPPLYTATQMVIAGYSGSGETVRPMRDMVLVRPILALPTTISWWIDYQNGTTVHDYRHLQPQALDTVSVRIAF